MSDITVAVVILPFLVVLTLALECTRVSCAWLYRQYRTGRVQGDERETGLSEEQRDLS